MHSFWATAKLFVLLHEQPMQNIVNILASFDLQINKFLDIQKTRTLYSFGHMSKSWSVYYKCCGLKLFLSLQLPTDVSVSVKNIGGTVCQRVRIWGIGIRRNVRLCHMQFSFQMCLETGDGSGTFRSRRWHCHKPGKRLLLLHWLW